MSKFIWSNGRVDIESELGHLSQEFVDDVDASVLINKCFHPKSKGGDTMEFDDFFDFDTGFFDHTERNTYDEEHPQDIVEREINQQIEEEEHHGL